MISEIKTIKGLQEVLKEAFDVRIKELPNGNLINIWYAPDTDVTKIYTNIKISTIINLVELDTDLNIE